MKNITKLIVAAATVCAVSAAPVDFSTFTFNAPNDGSNFDITYGSAFTLEGVSYDINVVAGTGYTAGNEANNGASGTAANVNINSGSTLVPFTFTVLDAGTTTAAALPAAFHLDLTFTDIDLNEQIATADATQFSLDPASTVSVSSVGGVDTFTANGSGQPSSALNSVDLRFGPSPFVVDIAGGLNGSGTEPASRNFQIVGEAYIPEPTSAALLGLGGLALLGRRKRA